MRILYILLCLLVLSCNSESNIFPIVKDVSELNKTDFSPTLEESFNTNKNIIYAATIPYAWDEIEKEINKPLQNFESQSLEGIHQSESFINALKEDEYQTSVIVDGDLIKAKAHFRKSLPFENPLTKFVKPLMFDTTEVESFGFYGSSDFSKINYFIDDDNFSISLLPKNKEHEIILIRLDNKKSSYQNFNDFFEQHKKHANKKRTERNAWRYEFNEEDKVEIPIVAFNLEKSFDNIIGSKFKSTSQLFEIIEFYQQNALVLNEKGAEVESIVEITVAATDAMDIIEEKPRPKLMIFNKPFVVFLKRKDAVYPYFGVYVQNGEILKVAE